MSSIPVQTVLVPLASEDDAETTAQSLIDYLDPDSRVVLVHVAEKAGGAPDKTGVEQSEEHAEKLFTIARAHLEAEDRSIETRVLYGTDVADTIHEAAVEIGADLIVFSPREASRLTRLLSGDVALDLIRHPSVPVLVLPTPDDDQP